MIDVVVRHAVPADLDQLGEMGAALAQLHHDFDPLRFMDGAGFADGYRSWFASELRRHNAMLRVVDGEAQLSGYVYGRLQGKDWAELLDEHAALVDIFVRPAGRHRGVGSALVRAFCEWAKEKGAPRVVLSTSSKNVAAQRLFAKSGFRCTMLEMTRES